MMPALDEQEEEEEEEEEEKEDGGKHKEGDEEKSWGGDRGIEINENVENHEGQQEGVRGKRELQRENIGSWTEGSQLGLTARFAVANATPPLPGNGNRGKRHLQRPAHHQVVSPRRRGKKS